MKPRARWLTSFTSWFFNASPEWVAPEQQRSESAGESGGSPSQETQRMPPSEPSSGDAATGDCVDPDRQPR
jgi:hypothetical protein